MMKKYFILVTLCLLLTSTPLFAKVVKPRTIPQKPLSELSLNTINQLFNEANFVYKTEDLKTMAVKLGHNLNGSLLIASHDSVLVKCSFGYERLYRSTVGMTATELKELRLKKDNKLTDSTYFELASISKQFTAAAVLQLVSKGVIKLTDSLYRFFPNLPYRNVTIHQMLSHTSGLPEYFNFPFSYFDTSHLLTNNELIDVLEKKKPTIQFPRGSNFEYTNTNYALLAAIVEQKSGMKFEEYMRKNIFTPAGMRNSFYVTQLEKNKDLSIAKGHLKGGDELPYFFMDGTFGDKGLYSNPTELLLWKIAYFNEYKILPKEWVEKAIMQQNKLPGKAKPSKLYGYGWRLEDNDSYGRLIYHGGLWRGFQHILVYRPTDNFFMVILSNCRNGAHLGKSNEILHIMDGV